MGMKVRDLSLQYCFNFESKASLFCRGQQFSCCLSDFFIFSCNNHHFFIFILSFNHFAHYLKYPNYKQLSNDKFQYLFASFAFNQSKCELLCLGPIILSTVQLAASHVLFPVRVAVITINEKSQ